MAKKKLTTVAGTPVADNQNSMTAGPRGPMLMQDVWFLEKLAHFDREVIPVNQARCPVHGYHRDGAMRVDDNFGGTLGYEPNSYDEWQEQAEFREPPLALDGEANRWDHREDDDDYFSQAGALFRMMSPEQQKVLFENTARAMGDAPKAIKDRHIANCAQADPDYGKGVADALNRE